MCFSILFRLKKDNFVNFIFYVDEIVLVYRKGKCF